jgi:hypothetical protein
MNSAPFVKIVASNLCSVGDIAIPDSDMIRVVSILGKARMGKSTFLNAIVSQLTGKNATPFATQDNDEHCTRGIDAYYCKANSLLLLDCQGLALEDSSHDPALLLFAYLISDTIIFNERMMLQNEALKLLEPICTFMTYIDIEEIKKPKLYFRISDGDMVKDPRKNLEKVMTHYKDQYQSIRDSVTHLFQPGIGIVKTDTLDRVTKAHIQTGNYAALFSATDELGFAAAIRNILSGLPKGQPAATWKHSIPRIIQNINRNEKITIDKLDIVGQTGRIEILEWVTALSPDLFKEIPVDATQATYDMHVEPRKAQKKKTLTEFTRNFKSVSSAIKDSHYTTLSERLATPIEEATKRSIVCAEKVVAEAVSAARNATLAPITTEKASLTHTTEAFFDTYLAVFRRVQNICKNVYQPVREKYESWVKTQEDALMALVEAICKEEEQEVQAMTAMCDGVVERFEATAIAKITAMTDYIIRGKSQSILGVEPKDLIQAIIDKATQYATTNFTRKAHRISFACVPAPVFSRSIMGSRGILTGEHAIAFDTLQPIYDTFVGRIQAFAYSSVLLSEVSLRKNALLYGYSLPRTTIIPGVKFIKVNHAILSHAPVPDIVSPYSVMTFDTYHAIYKKYIEGTLCRMVEKGYIKEEDKTKLFNISHSSESDVVSVGNHEHKFISEIFFHAFTKIIARARVAGEPITLRLQECGGHLSNVWWSEGGAFSGPRPT